MRSFHYRPGRNAAAALMSGSVAAFGGWLWWTDGDLVWMISMAVAGLAALKSLANAFNTEAAVKFDHERLWVRTSFGSHMAPWSKVYGMAVQVMTVRYWGIIPVNRRETLCITVEGGSFGARRLRVPAGSIELPAGGVSELLQILRDAQRTAIGTAGVAMAGAGDRGWGVPSKVTAASAESLESGFDADAAIARYLASKEATQNSPRAEVPSPAPAVPQRPVFGRRQPS